MALRKPPALTSAAARPRASMYTAQDLANFCEVDLKTVHHWAERGKVAHLRTEGRHLRFRRNDVVRFLRAHGYPLPEALVKARPSVSLALPASTLEGAPLSLDDIAKRLGSRFSVRRHANGISAVAHLVAEAPDALIIASDDPTFALAAVAALKLDASTAWLVIATITAAREAAAAESGAGAGSEAGAGGEASAGDAGADIVLAGAEIAKLPGDLARALAVV